jgi:SEC-C motif-containing protein
MRSRYAAYVLGLTAYILATQLQKSSPLEIEEFSKKTKFIGLKILDAQETTVTFTAILSQDGRDVSFTEKSHFAKDNGKWVYVKGSIASSSEG